MNGFTKAQTGIIAMLVVILVSITRRLPERRFSSGTTTRLILTGAVMLLVLAVCSVPVYAACCAESLPTAITGTVNGGIYVGGGHGLQSIVDDPYKQDFDVPDGTVKWARLYTAVFAHDNPGWINISFYNAGTGYTNINKYVTPSDGCDNTDQDGCYIGGGTGGTYWRYWNVTSITQSGYNNATVHEYSVGGLRVNGMILVVVYDTGEELVYYWVNEGLLYQGDYTEASCRNCPNSMTSFNGAMDISANASLWTVSMLGSSTDQLYFNSVYDVDGDGDDTTDSCGSTPDSSWNDGSFDVDRWDIHKNWLESTNNDLTFNSLCDGATRDLLAVFSSEKPKPDLTIPDLDTLVDLPDGQTPTAHVANHVYAINATVANIGNDATGGAFNVAFEVDGVRKSTTNIAAGLGAREETVATYQWTPTIAKGYILNAIADADGDVLGESSETNNATSEPVTVLAEGLADLEIAPDNITFHPAHANHAANNDTIVRIAVRNNGAGDAGNAGNTFKVQVVNTSTSVVLNETTTWLSAMCYRTVDLEVTLPKGLYSVTVKLDPDNSISESSTGNNNAADDVNIVVCRVRDTHTYGNASAYNGPHSNYIPVEMFDVVKLAPEGANPVELAASVASSSDESGRGFHSLDGIEELGGHATQWAAFANGIPAQSWEYPLHDGDTIHWDFLTYINSGTGQQSFKARPVMDYPEPFVHGYNGTVYDITIVYPDELLYPDKAAAVEAGLIASGVSAGRINKKAVEAVTGPEKQNNNLILLGTPSNNPLIADINSQRLDVGLPSYFDGSYMTDDSDDTSYVGGVVEACDNPYDGKADDSEANRSVWLAAAVEDHWAYKAADMLASDTGRLDRFWVNREPNLVPTQGSVILDWTNWETLWGGSCTGNYNIYITNNLTAGLPATPTATVPGTTWTDNNAGDDDQRYYKVTCSAGGTQVNGVAGKITYELKKCAISGINWISPPCANPPVTNADDLLDDIDNAEPLTYGDNVKWWNSTNQQIESRMLTPSGGGSYKGTLFDVKPARGYEVVISTDTTWTVVGWVPSICPIELKKGAISGINWIGVPFNTTLYDADELLDDIDNAEPLTYGDNVKWWNSTNQQIESRMLTPSGGGSYKGTLFDVKPARGYEVVISTDTTWVPR